MMRTISVMNYKGGTGKTCTVVSLAHGLAQKGYKVLIIDTDPQGSASHHLGITPTHTIYDLIVHERPIESCVVQARKNLHIIGGNEHLYPAELLMAKMKNKEHVLSRRLSNLEGYHFVILDCAPSMNLLNQNALLFTREILLPVSMEYLSLIGVKQLLKNIKIVNRMFKRSVSITKVIPTFYDKRNKKSKDILESLRRVFPGLISSPIHTSVSLSEAPGYRQTIFEYDPNSKGAEDYLQLTQEVLEHGQEKAI